jgi:hypothetical protein
VLFGGLERDLVEAIQRHDSAALDRLLSDDFELRGNVHPGEAVTREDGQEAVLAAAPSSTSGGSTPSTFRAARDIPPKAALRSLPREGSTDVKPDLVRLSVRRVVEEAPAAAAQEELPAAARAGGHRRRHPTVRRGNGFVPFVHQPEDQGEGPCAESRGEGMRRA